MHEVKQYSRDELGSVHMHAIRQFGHDEDGNKTLAGYRFYLATVADAREWEAENEKTVYVTEKTGLSAADHSDCYFDRILNAVEGSYEQLLVEYQND